MMGNKLCFRSPLTHVSSAFGSVETDKHAPFLFHFDSFFFSFGFELENGRFSIFFLKLLGLVQLCLEMVFGLQCLSEFLWPFGIFLVIYHLSHFFFFCDVWHRPCNAQWKNIIWALLRLDFFEFGVSQGFTLKSFGSCVFEVSSDTFILLECFWVWRMASSQSAWVWLRFKFGDLLTFGSESYCFGIFWV